MRGIYDGTGKRPNPLTGATGYVGGRLLGALERRGSPVRCLSRRPEALAHRTGENTSVVAGDVLDPSSLGAAFAGVRAGYYLIHSIGARASFQRADRVVRMFEPLGHCRPQGPAWAARIRVTPCQQH